ncbi:MAG TPA: Rieske 2Fe-2S domain-containing protein [Steroidobacteraceae bacterium]|nr:Rieske 2Fe-2S domain-containing protein [Steroidobacteraceae bacterium]
MSAIASHIRTHWFPVALSRRVDMRPRRVLLFDHPLVLARDSLGNVLALDDRCPHRGAPLSAGRLEADALTCPYHGWSFGRDGSCRAMPGAPGDRPLAQVRAAAWQVEERDGIVWVAAERSRPLPAGLLDLDPRRRRFLQETVWQAPIIEAQENFLDAMHTHRVHPGLVRRGAHRRQVIARARGTADGFEIDYHGQDTQNGLLYWLFESRRSRECAVFSGLSVAQLGYRYQSGWAAFITLCFCPQTAASTRVFAMLHVEGRFAPAWLVGLLVWPFLRTVARQDQRILGLQSSNLGRFPSHRHIVTPLDIARPLLEKAWCGYALDGEEHEAVLRI